MVNAVAFFPPRPPGYYVTDSGRVYLSNIQNLKMKQELERLRAQREALNQPPTAGNPP